MAKSRKVKNETSVSMRLCGDTHRILRKMAISKKTNVSNIIRQMIDKCLAKEEFREDIDDISANLIVHIKNYLEPQVSRIIKCVIKGSITSSAGYFLNAKALEEFIPPHRQQEFLESLQESRAMGVKYIQSRNKGLEAFMEDESWFNNNQ